MQSITESLKRQREQILADTSEEVLTRHTSLLEIIVISLYNRLVNRLSLDAEQFRSSVAVLALGHFGRGIIGPTQPVSLLFLTSDSKAWKESCHDEIVAPLKGAGWLVDVVTDTPASLGRRAREDFGFLLRLLDSRYVSGNRNLSDQLEKTLDEVIEGRQNELLEQLHASSLKRTSLLDDPQYWLEPHIEETPGGLADITVIRAACRIAAGVRSLEDAIFQGYLRRQEVDALVPAEKFYARLMSLLECLAPPCGGLLFFDHQELLAQKLGYADRAGFLPVETFMQHVYQLFHSVSCISREFWERLQEGRWGAGMGDETAFEEIEPGIAVRAGKIQLQTDRYPATASRLIHLFTVAARRGLTFSNVTRQWIQHHRNVLDTAAGDATVKDELLDLVRSDGPDLPVFRRFYDLGLLFSLIPELRAVHGLVQHDAFHLYPVQEHHLRTVTELKRLLLGDLAETEPDLTRLAGGIGDPVLLLLAGLLHDIGKSSGRGHAERGGEMIPSIAKRLGMTTEESDLMRFMVAQHLLLMDSASLRDLADMEMLSACAHAVVTPRNLDLLALLSFADMVATGPKARQKWRETPVLQLYGRILHLLEKGEPSPQAIAERIARIKAKVGEEVADLFGEGELDAYFSELAPRYLLSMHSQEIANHLRLARGLEHSGDPFVLEVSSTDGYADLTLICREIPGLLFRSAGIMTLHGMNIIGAQIFTMKEGFTLLLFHCRLAEDLAERPDWDSVREDMRRLLSGRLALDYRISALSASKTSDFVPLKSEPSRILIDNESSALYTILEVYTVDRTGLLYTITRTLFELQIRIYVAKITTKVDQVADVFYVRTLEGGKVTDPDQICEIQNALLYYLDGEISCE